MQPRDRRREPRYPARRPVCLTLPDGSRLRASTADLSASGLRIHSPERLPAGIHLALELAVNNRGQAITLWGHVQHCALDAHNSGFNLGLRHRNAPLPYQGLLRSLRLERWQPRH